MNTFESYEIINTEAVEAAEAFPQLLNINEKNQYEFKIDVKLKNV